MTLSYEKIVADTSAGGVDTYHFKFEKGYKNFRKRGKHVYPRLQINHPWEGYMEPFRLAGTVYFAGTYQASSHLIDTGDGLIIIDTGFQNTLYMVVDSISRLGFDLRNIRYILNSHWHIDHTDATATLAYLSGAETVIGKKDAPFLKEKGLFTPDILVSDGDVISLGNVQIRCVETPGHTPGTISFFFDTEQDAHIYHVGMFGGAGSNSLDKASPLYYEGSREDYLDSIERLMKEKVDIFIGNHCWNNDTKGRAERLAASDKNAAWS